MKKITICNNKGGVGKTTTVFNLVWFFTEKGLRTLAIDTDPQQNLTDNFGVNVEGYKGLGDYLLERNNKFEQVRINKNLLYYTLLDNFLKKIEKDYDIVIIDTAPSFNTYTASAVYTGGIYIPMIPGSNEFKALNSTIKFASYFGKKITGIILTRTEMSTAITQYSNTLLEENYKEYFLDTKIRKTVMIGEAIMMHKSIYDYAKKSKCAYDYRTLGEEIMKREGLV